MTHQVAGDINNIPEPFVVYCGDAQNVANAKVAAGLFEWAPERVAGKMYDWFSLFPDVRDVGLGDGKTLVVGCSPAGGAMNDELRRIIVKALEHGLHVAAALHDKLIDDPIIVEAANRYGKQLFDFRHRDTKYPLGTGKKRSGIRVLTVGTDCACGKKYTALSIYRAIRDKVPAVFCSTGQTGFLISGAGINNDTITADFLSGAAEYLSPNASPDTVFLIEGQGAIRHPAYAGGAVSLLTGSQPDFIVMCHTAGRETMLNTDRAISIEDEIHANLSMANYHGYKPKLLGLSVNAPLEKLNEFSGLNTLTFNPKFGGSEFDAICTTIINESIRRKHES